MAGGSEERSALAAEVLRLLGNALASGDRPGRVHTSDLRIYVEAMGLATFPDGAVVCGPLEQHSPSPEATALNPLVLLEVTSDSSEEYDTGGKLEMYRTIPSLRDYVIVSHRERRITVHHRDGRGEWSTRVAIRAGRVLVESVGPRWWWTRSTAAARSPDRGARGARVRGGGGSAPTFFEP